MKGLFLVYTIHMKLSFSFGQNNAFLNHFRDVFCLFPFRWIYSYGSNKSTGKETGKTYLCALGYRQCPRLMLCQDKIQTSLDWLGFSKLRSLGNPNISWRFSRMSKESISSQQLISPSYKNFTTCSSSSLLHGHITSNIPQQCSLKVA